MFQSTQRSLNTSHNGVSNQIYHSNDDGGSVAFPPSLTFRMPDGASFTIEGIDASLTLKDLAKSLHEGGGNSTRGFPPIELGCSFDFFFGSRSYVADSSLSSIHKEVNLNDCQDVQ